MIDPEDIVGPEWAEWYRMTPQERWAASARLWADYLALGGDLVCESESDQPIFNPQRRSHAKRLTTKLTSRASKLDVKLDLVAIAQNLSKQVPGLNLRTDQRELVRIYLRGRSTIVTIESRDGRYEARALLIIRHDLERSRPSGYMTFSGIAEVNQVAAWLRDILATCA
jgi:hypothetical protein